jgi:hypothetical protein
MNLARIFNPGVPWWVAVPCNVLAGAAPVLLYRNRAQDMTVALILLGVAAIALYGTALGTWLYRRRG